MYLRKQILSEIDNQSLFLWGARQTGKSTLLKRLFPESVIIDLLMSDVFERFNRHPEMLRQTVLAQKPQEPVIIDEVQRVPSLLNEVHWLISNHNYRFILCGSSPRNILRSGMNLLGGRAIRQELYPLVSSEVPGFDLLKALNNGLLPRHYDIARAGSLLSAYIGSYLRDEIFAEARLRNIQSFSRFLDAAAFSNGEIVNYSNIALDCGVSSPTIREYFQILEDTMTARFLPVFQKRPKRRVIHAPKFYFFDVGVANYLLKRNSIEVGSEAFGKAFEHFIYHEIYAYSHYSGLNYPVYYWRTASQIEVDFILGDHEVAIEVKGSSRINSRHLKGLYRFSEEYPVRKMILVSTDPIMRQVDDILLMPWQFFLEQLWSGDIIS